MPRRSSLFMIETVAWNTACMSGIPYRHFPDIPAGIIPDFQFVTCPRYERHRFCHNRLFTFWRHTSWNQLGRCGILLHPTSLPGPYGSGDFGPDAYYFADWLASARQSCWQMLPLCDIGTGNSPYMSPSAFAGNIFLIGLDALCNAGWLKKEELVPDNAFQRYRVHYPAAIAFRMSRLKLAADRFFGTTETTDTPHFRTFLRTKCFLAGYLCSLPDIERQLRRHLATMARSICPQEPCRTGRICRKTCRRYPFLENSASGVLTNSGKLCVPMLIQRVSTLSATFRFSFH